MQCQPASLATANNSARLPVARVQVGPIYLPVSRVLTCLSPTPRQLSDPPTGGRRWELRDSMFPSVVEEFSNSGAFRMRIVQAVGGFKIFRD